MGNMELYEKFRKVPDEAKKTIQGGRLNGKTDINPMWRIKMLTQEFGPAGKGWYAPITERWTETGANGEITANIRINLYVKYGDEWGMPIEGIGGSLLIPKETSGLRTDDDAFKKAYTDALSVACKALGIGADVYYEKDPTKYEKQGEDDDKKVKPIAKPQQSAKNAPKTNDNAKSFVPLTKEEIARNYCVKNVQETIVWFEGKFGVEFANWGEDETAIARAKLQQKKEERERKEREEKRKMSRISDADIPFPMED